MRIIFDTNVLISSLMFKGFSSEVFDFCIVNYHVFSSDWLMSELSEKLIKKFKLTDLQTERYIDILKERIVTVFPFNDLPTICRDADDNHVLQLAAYLQVECIITGDKDLLVLEQFETTKIFSPRQFYEKFIIH